MHIFYVLFLTKNILKQITESVHFKYSDNSKIHQTTQKATLETRFQHYSESLNFMIILAVNSNVVQAPTSVKCSYLLYDMLTSNNMPLWSHSHIQGVLNNK